MFKFPTSVSISCAVDGKAISSLSERGTEYGVFLRMPIYKKVHDLFPFTDSSGGLDDTLNKRGFIGIVNWILNSAAELRSIKDFIENNDNAAAYSIRTLRSPVYFSREYRSLKVVWNSGSVESVGFNYIDESVSGACVSEKTRIRLKVFDKWVTLKSKTTKSYKNTYDSNVVDAVNKLLSGGTMYL